MRNSLPITTRKGLLEGGWLRKDLGSLGGAQATFMKEAADDINSLSTAVIITETLLHVHWIHFEHTYTSNFKGSMH